MPAFYTEAGIANWRGRLHESGIGDFDHDVAPEAPELISVFGWLGLNCDIVVAWAMMFTREALIKLGYS